MDTIPNTREARQRERLQTEIFPDASAAARLLASEIADLINERASHNLSTVLGLATGSTPVCLYRELIRLHQEEALSFRTVTTFNLDEYHGLSREHPQSYWQFMHEHFFNHVDIAPANIHVPDGMVARQNAFEWCAAYEQKIHDAGGIDLQILGIGRTGHVGFNEPGSTRDTRTRIVTLDSLTRSDAARDFLGENNVPRHAITMGMGTILEARRIVLLAWGAAKATIVAQGVEAVATEAIPASLLQGHVNTRVLVDTAAAQSLTRVSRPWLVGSAQWTPRLVRRAVTWLSRHLGKPVLKLIDEHYNEHGMADLLTSEGAAYGLNIRIFNQLQHTITGWPGGKFNADDTHRPERAAPYPKRVLILTPEPSDDVLAMGGTLRRLVVQGHHVVVAHFTSGNLSVPDDEAAMAADLLRELNQVNNATTASFIQDISIQLEQKKKHDPDSPLIRKLKTLIRRSETRASLRDCGIKFPDILFLDLPFYENGRYRQFKPDSTDAGAIVALLRRCQPHQIFTTGHGDDPSTVAANCFSLLRHALRQTQSENWQADCRIWLYRRSDMPAIPAEVDMVMPLSPVELRQKIQAAFHHKSQRSQHPGGGEAWQQAETYNRTLAQAYDQLGLADYEALEAFQLWHDNTPA